MKKILLLGVFVLFSLHVFGQFNTNFRSFQSGAWNDPATWEEQIGGVWTNPATAAPIVNSALITISHQITITASLNIDQLTVESGGTLIINSGTTLTIAAGPGEDLTINSGGTITNNGSLAMGGLASRTVQVYGTFNNLGSVSGSNVLRLFFQSGSLYDHKFSATPGAIPQASWNSNSTCLISGYTTNEAIPLGLGQSFGNFIWNTPNLANENGIFDLNGTITSLTGSLSILSTNSLDLYLTNSSTYTLSVAGGLLINGGNVSLTYEAASVVVDINGDLTVSSGSLNLVGSDGVGSSEVMVAGNVNISNNGLYKTGQGTGRILFDGTTTQNFSSSSTILDPIDYEVANNATLNLGTSALTGPGTFILNGESTLILGSTHAQGAIQTGPSAGNIRVTGVRTFSPGATLVYNGVSTQALGNGFPTNVNLTISNTGTSPNNAVNLSSNITIAADRVLNFVSGKLGIGNHILTLDGTVTGTSLFSTTTTSELVINGTGDFGTLNFDSANPVLSRLRVNRGTSGVVTLGSSLRVLGLLDMNNGQLRLNGQTLYLIGSTVRNLGVLHSNNPNSHLYIESNVSIPDYGLINFAPSPNNSIGLLTIDRDGGSVSFGTNFTITNAINLTSGALNIPTNNVTMASSATTIYRAAGTISKAPVASPSYNVVYNNLNDITAGFELPIGSTALNNLTVDASADIILSNSVTVNGNLTIIDGTLNTNSSSNHPVNLKGNFDNQVGVLGFAGNNSTVTFSGLTQTLSGVTNFYSLVLGPTTSLNINGNTSVSNSLNISSGLINAGTNNFGGAANVTMNGGELQLAKTGVALPEFTGTYTLSGGTITLNGSGAQEIRILSSPYFNFTNASTSAKTFTGGPLVISNVLDLSSGGSISGGEVSLTSTSANALVLNSPGTGFINGTLTRAFTTSGTYIFPVGLSDVKRIDIAPTSTGGNTTISASFATPAAGNVEPGTDGNATYTEVSTTGYWIVNGDAPIAGTITYDMTIYPAGFDQQAGAAFTILKRVGAGNWQLVGNLVAGNPSTNFLPGGGLGRTGMLGFSNFAMGISSTPTPVELLSFTAKQVSDHVKLDWITASETNSSHFEIQRSIDAVKFDSIGTVASAGNSSSRVNYDFLDRSARALPAKVIYYRLKQVDFNGQSETFPMQAVHFDSKNDEPIVVFPNPANNVVNIDCFLKEDVKLLIISPLGKTLAEKSINQFTTTLDVSNYEKGVYVFKFVNGSSTINKKVIIQ